MKIMFVTSTLTSGGSERVISLIANDLAAKGYDVEIICLQEPIVFYSLHKKVKIRFAENEAGKFIVAKMRWLRRRVIEEKPDVVIAFMILVYLTTLFSLVGLNVPIITSERNDPASFSWWKRALRRVLLPRTTCHVVQTQKIKDYYTEDIKKKTVIIGNPVTNKVFDVVPVEKDDVIINVARLFPQKNQKMLIQAFYSIHEMIPTYKLKIFGEGPCRPELEKLIGDLRLVGKVFLCGRSEQVLDEMNQSRIFVLSSNHEGLSNAMIEAICIGLPIVSTKVSGTEELIEDGKNGILTDVGNEKMFAQGMLKVANDEKLRNVMEVANRQKAEKFKEEEVLMQWERIINEVICKFKG